MRIISKDMDKDATKSIVYLVDENDNPLKAKIVNYDKKREFIDELLNEYFNGDTYHNHLTEITYQQYINQ
jgi:hypothetical protein